MRILLLLVVLAGLPGCAWHRRPPKPQTHIYAGDAPKIHYIDRPEAAGGELNTY